MQPRELRMWPRIALLAAILAAAAAKVDVEHWIGSECTGKSVIESHDSLQEAVDRLAQLGCSRGCCAVHLSPGTHFVPSPLRMSDAHSGSPESPVQIDVNGPGEALVTSARQITGFAPSKVLPGAFEAPVPPDVQPFNQLFVSGQRRTRARTPNPTSDPSDPDQYLHWVALLPGDQATLGLQVRASDLPNFAQPSLVEFVVYHKWTTSRNHASSVNRTTGVVTFSNAMSALDGPSDPSANTRYYFENAIEALDAPGEWFFDPSRRSLFYIPITGEDSKTLVATVPQTTELLSLNGTSNHAYRSITFAYGDWSCGATEVCDAQAAAFQSSAAVHVTESANITFEGCSFAHLGSYALWAHRGTTGLRVDASHFFDLGTGGVRIGDMDGDVRSSGSVVNNSVIEDGGHVFRSGVGVLVHHSSGNWIVHNSIHDLEYTGISVGWTWGYATSAANHNLVAYNHIYNIGRYQLTDMGGVYTLGISTGSMVDHNLIHDVYSYDYGGWCLYADEGTSQLQWSNNVCHSVKSAVFHQHYGMNNTIVNNVLAMGGEDPGQVHAQPDGGVRTEGRPDKDNSFTFARNIVYATAGALFYGHWVTSSQPVYRAYEFDDNLYFSPGGMVPMTFGDGTSIDAWRARGYDAHSVVGADPLFVNATGFDFSLQAGSPALALGFQPIDLSQVGPQRPVPERTGAAMPWSSGATFVDASTA